MSDTRSYHRWKAEGLKGLEHRPRSGRPAIADEVYLRVVEAALEQDPGELGYDFTLWTQSNGSISTLARLLGSRSVMSDCV
jgi:transposase